MIDAPPFAKTVAASSYSHPWDDLIARFKFHGAIDLAWPLARVMREAGRRDEAIRETLFVPMPLSPMRLRERGYNQSWELARRLSRLTGAQANGSLLKRTKESPPQSSLPLDRRAENVRSAYGVTRQGAQRILHRHVTLVDDVMTSGSSARSAAESLLDAGASEVEVWVIARTPKPQDC